MHLFEKRVFSESGSSELVKEQATFMQFSDLLEELEGTFSLPKYIMSLVRTSHILVILCLCLCCIYMLEYTHSIYAHVGGIEVEGDSTGTFFLSECLSFFTGASRIPPTGFDKACTLTFNGINVYPTASTCAFILTLPTLYYNSYPTFK